MDPEGSHWLIQAKDFDKQRQIRWSNLARFSPIGGTSRYELKLDDVLFLARGQDNFACHIDRDLKATVVANTFYILRPNQEMVLSPFLAWWLNQTPAQDYIKLRRSGGSLPFISISALLQLEISIPTFEIQNKILELEKLRKQEANLTASLFEKKSVLIEAVSLNAINE